LLATYLVAALATIAIVTMAFYFRRNHPAEPKEVALADAPADQDRRGSPQRGYHSTDSRSGDDIPSSRAPVVRPPPRAPDGVAGGEPERSWAQGYTEGREAYAPQPRSGLSHNELLSLQDYTNGLARALGELETVLEEERSPGLTGSRIRDGRYEKIGDAYTHIGYLQADVERCTQLARSFLDEVHEKRDQVEERIAEQNEEIRRQEADLRKGLPAFMLRGAPDNAFLNLLMQSKREQPELADRLEAALRAYATTTRHSTDESEYIGRVYDVGERLSALLRSLDAKMLPARDIFDETIVWMTEVNNECHGRCSAYIPVLGAAFNENEMSADRPVVRVAGYRAWGVKNSKGILVRTAKVD
jgi:hypothetical protein